jgi:acetylornithine deacetylase/succinyl-diaminopimelate desuccinylase-like protein
MTTNQLQIIKELKELYEKNKDQALQDYFTFLRFKSISAEMNYQDEIPACANWLFNYLKDIGLETELWQTIRHPVIFASYLKAGPDKPTLLIYNHYDVQPVDPLSEWTTPPFEPTVRNGQVYARGAQDNKGQCFYVIQAIKALLDANKQLPINIKLIIEGEEEAGSFGISQILSQNKNKLKADYLAIVDVGLRAPSKPAVTLGVRGIVAMDVDVEGSQTDLHSGTHGGLVYNPLHALVEILAKLRDADGKIAVPHFYDDVEKMTDDEKSFLTLEFDENEYQSIYGTTSSGGEKNFSPMERAWTRPTIEINGISGGYSGLGFKTVIPAKAHAKISCRLVPNQDPQKIGRLVADFIESKAPKGVKVRVQIHPGGGKAVRSSPSSNVVQAFAKAYSEVYNAPCEFIFEGGSIPIVTELAKASGSEVVLVGVGLGDDQIHAPNEHFGLDRFEKGFLIISRTLFLLAEKK